MNDFGLCNISSSGNGSVKHKFVLELYISYDVLVGLELERLVNTRLDFPIARSGSKTEASNNRSKTLKSLRISKDQSIRLVNDDKFSLIGQEFIVEMIFNLIFTAKYFPVVLKVYFISIA